MKTGKQCKLWKTWLSPTLPVSQSPRYVMVSNQKTTNAGYCPLHVFGMICKSTLVYSHQCTLLQRHLCVIGHAHDVLLHAENDVVHLACKTPLSITFAPSLILAATAGHNRPGPAKGPVPCRDGTRQAYQEPSSACIRIYLPDPVASKYIPATTQAED